MSVRAAAVVGEEEEEEEEVEKCYADSPQSIGEVLICRSALFPLGVTQCLSACLPAGMPLSL